MDSTVLAIAHLLFKRRNVQTVTLCTIFEPLDIATPLTALVIFFINFHHSTEIGINEEFQLITIFICRTHRCMWVCDWFLSTVIYILPFKIYANLYVLLFFVTTCNFIVTLFKRVWPNHHWYDTAYFQSILKLLLYWFVIKHIPYIG